MLRHSWGGRGAFYFGLSSRMISSCCSVVFLEIFLCVARAVHVSLPFPCVLLVREALLSEEYMNSFWYGLLVWQDHFSKPPVAINSITTSQQAVLPTNLLREFVQLP